MLTRSLQQAVSYFVLLFEILIFCRVFLSWVPSAQGTKFAIIVRNLTEPLIGPIRKLLMKSPLGGRGMMLDFSPFIALILLQLGERVLYSLIATF